MFVNIVHYPKDQPHAFFCDPVESYREDERIKHRTIHSFGLSDENQVPFLKAMYAKKKPHLIYEDQGMQHIQTVIRT